MEIRIENLNMHPEYVGTVIDWIYSEWGCGNYKYWSSWIRSSLSEKDIPKTFIVLVDGRIAGTYSLWRCDLQSRQDLFPWFGGLYVHQDFRGKLYDGKKIGERLLSHARNELKELGYENAYLFTAKNPQYYVKNGWIVIDHIPNYYDEMVTLCKLTIN